PAPVLPSAPAPAVAAPAAPQAVTAVPAAAAPTPAAPAAPPAPPAPARPAPPSTAASVVMDRCEKPRYPAASEQLEEEGTVTLRFLVGVDGRVLKSEVEKSSGFRRLDEAARVAIARCQFIAATQQGQPVEQWVTIRYVWKL
ncbi:MAG: energy transducer TonB, partial [Limnohabitans sp.]